MKTVFLNFVIVIIISQIELNESLRLYKTIGSNDADVNAVYENEPVQNYLDEEASEEILGDYYLFMFIICLKHFFQFN